MNTDDMGFESLSDEELAALVRAGNGDALDFLMNKYKGLVKAKSRQYYIAGGDRDDLIQEGMIGLYKAVMGFDPEKLQRFYSFAELCVVRQIISAVKGAARKKHNPLNRYVELGDDNAGNSALTGDSPEDVVISREGKAALEGKMGSALSELESRALALHLRGHGYAEIAAMLGCSVKSVDNALQRVRRKISKIVGDDSPFF